MCLFCESEHRVTTAKITFELHGSSGCYPVLFRDAIAAYQHVSQHGMLRVCEQYVQVTGALAYA